MPKELRLAKREAMKVAQSDIEDIDFILDERAQELVGEQLRVGLI